MDLRTGAVHTQSTRGEEKAGGDTMEAKIQDQMVERGGKGTLNSSIEPLSKEECTTISHSYRSKEG